MKIDPKIEADSAFICQLIISELRLMKDGDVDWFILIPLINDIVDWSDLTFDHQIHLTNEITYISKLLKEQAPHRPDKINVANLGNVVSQFHVHLIGRLKSDRAWPSPIWGSKAVKEFTSTKIDYWKGKIRENSIF